MHGSLGGLTGVSLDKVGPPDRLHFLSEDERSRAEGAICEGSMYVP